MVRLHSPLAMEAPLSGTAALIDKNTGVMGLTRADANSYGHMNIRINAVCPG